MKEISNFKISCTNAQFTPQRFCKFTKKKSHKIYRDLTISHIFYQAGIVDKVYTA